MEIEKKSYGETIEYFGIERKDISTYSPLTLAYIGDAIYELVVRTIIVSEGNTQVNKLHHRCANIVKAEAQSKIIRQLKEELSEEELAVFKRGRNAKPNSCSKNATISDYKTATGFEALVGYLYMMGKEERIYELIKKGIEILR